MNLFISVVLGGIIGVALHSYIKLARRQERDRCAFVADSMPGFNGKEIGEAIRRLK